VISAPKGHPGEASLQVEPRATGAAGTTIADVTTEARYDAYVGWFEDFRPALGAEEQDALERLLGPGRGRLLDIGCGTGVAIPVLQELGWSVVGIDVSEEMLGRARVRGADVVQASGDSLPFEDASFDAAAAIWIHTDVDDFGATLREAARVLRPHAPLVCIGAHPCFVGPHSRYIGAVGVPVLHPGYRVTDRYDKAPGISPEGLRARVGATHLPLGLFLQAFLDAGFALERFEELENREYPYMVGLRCRR
jgi:SAM-dependent methyltransferase